MFISIMKMQKNIYIWLLWLHVFFMPNKIVPYSEQNGSLTNLSLNKTVRASSIEAHTMQNIIINHLRLLFLFFAVRILQNIRLLHCTWSYTLGSAANSWIWRECVQHSSFVASDWHCPISIWNQFATIWLLFRLSSKNYRKKGRRKKTKNFLKHTAKINGTNGRITLLGYFPFIHFPQYKTNRRNVPLNRFKINIS